MSYCSWASGLIKRAQRYNMTKFIFFYGGIYSQWYRSPMIINGTKYNCAEQYMMQQKAITFNDTEIANAVMRATNPMEQKALGRQIREFNIAEWNVWNVVCKNVVYDGNFAKFTQHADLRDELMATGDAELVEASPTDVVWGIGLAENDPRRFDKTQWRGTNWLGEVIMQVRETLKRGDV